MAKIDITCEPSKDAYEALNPLGRKLQGSDVFTRRQVADFIRDELGRPMSFSTAAKLAALGEFAEPVVWWGRRPLYTRDDLRAWAEARSRPTKERAVPQSTNRVTEDREEKRARKTRSFWSGVCIFRRGRQVAAQLLKALARTARVPPPTTSGTSNFSQDAE